MNIIITGGTGFIGSHIIKQLSNTTHSITVLARNKNKISALHSIPNLKVVECEMNNFEEIRKQLKNQDVLIHVALNYVDNPSQMLINDTYQSVFLFEEAAKNGLKQIIYTSSTAVADFVYMTDYGRKEFDNKKIDEKYRPRPTSNYGAGKASCELFLNAISHQYPIRTNIIRPGYIFGNPAFDDSTTQPDTRFYDIVKAAIDGEDIVVTENDGTQFLWADDIAKVYLKLMDANLNRECFFVLGKKFYSWETVAQIAISKTNSKSKIKIIKTDNKYKSSSFDVSKLEQSLGFCFDDGLQKIEFHIDYLIEKISQKL